MNAVVRTRTIYIESSKQGNDDSKKAATTNEVSCKYSSLYSKSSATKNKSNLKLNSKSTHGIVENQPHLPRFSRIRAQLERHKHDSRMKVKLSRVDSL